MFAIATTSDAEMAVGGVIFFQCLTFAMFIGVWSVGLGLMVGRDRETRTLLSPRPTVEAVVVVLVCSMMILIAWPGRPGAAWPEFLPVATILIGGALAVAHWARRRTLCCRRNQAVVDHRCPECGYAISASGQCPECGAEIAGEPGG